MKVLLCLLALLAFSSSQSTCTVCDYVVKALEGVLNNAKTEQEILNELQEGCLLLPAPLDAKCQEIIQTKGPEIISTFLHEADPNAVCRAVGLCTSAKRVVEDVQQGGCSVCQLIVSYVESYMAQNQTEQQIIQQLDQVCALLGPLGSTCDQFVEQYVPQLIQWIEAGESPAVFCNQVGLCSSSKRAVVDTQQGGCSVCQLVVSYVESYMAQNQTEQQIIQQLDQVCALLGPLGSTCDQFVEQYVPQLIQWIEAGESPAIFCNQVGLCSSSKRAVVDTQQGGCSVCQLVVSYVETFLQQNRSLSLLEGELDQLCSLLGPLSSTCDSFVALYTPQLVQWIISNEPPQKFCGQVGLCSTPTRGQRRPTLHKPKF